MSLESNNQINDMSEDPEISLPTISLKEVYPMPRYSIKDAVMEKIAAERAGGTGEKILKADVSGKISFRDKIRKNKRMLVNCGGMAACFAILCAVLIIAVPTMEKANDSAKLRSGDYNGLFTPSEAFALDDNMEIECDNFQYYLADEDVADRDSEISYSKTTGGTMENATSAATEYSASMEEEGSATGSTVNDSSVVMQSQVYMAVTEAMTQQETNMEEIEEAALDDVYPEMVNGIVDISHIKIMVAEQLVQADYTAWMTSNGYMDISSCSLAELVTEFGIAREVLTDTVGEYAAWIDMDILYGEIVKTALSEKMTASELDELILKK